MRFKVDSKIVIQLIICTQFPLSLPTFAADLFESDDVLVIKLSGPLNALIRNQQEEQAYPFVLQAGGIDHQIKVRARGNSRKKICSFPPLRLEFEKTVPEGSAFYKKKDLKLITHCKNSARAQANMLKEFAAYKFFSLLTNAAYRVRLLQIDYADTSNKRSTRQWAFLIEPTVAMAKRIGGEPVKQSAVSLKSLNDQQEALVYVFQYLIGNTDWSLVSAETSESCCHNGKLVKKKHETL